MKIIVIILTIIVVFVLGFYLVKANKTAIPDQPSITPSPTIHATTDEDQIIKSISEKNNWNPSDVELNISVKEGDYAKGNVKFKNEMGGGLWFAAKVDGVWKIVYDGNGIITCDLLVNYQNFPKKLIPSCFNKETNQVVTR